MFLQGGIANGVCVDDWRDELAITASNGWSRSLFELFTINTHSVGVKGYYSSKKLPPVGLDLMITGSRV